MDELRAYFTKWSKLERENTHTHTHTHTHHILAHMRCAQLLQSCLTLCNPMACSLPGSSVHGIFLVGILEWIAISFSKGSSQSGDQTQVSWVSCIADRFFTAEPGKPINTYIWNRERWCWWTYLGTQRKRKYLLHDSGNSNPVFCEKWCFNRLRLWGGSLESSMICKKDNFYLSNW